MHQENNSVEAPYHVIRWKIYAQKPLNMDISITTQSKKDSLATFSSYNAIPTSQSQFKAPCICSLSVVLTH